jgi:hypothetical protein
MIKILQKQITADQPTKSDLNLDFSSFEKEKGNEKSNQNIPKEPAAVVFSQNPYYDENIQTNETEGAVTFSQSNKS